MSVTQFSAVGILDDDISEAEVVKYQLEDIGLKPVLFGNGFSDLDDLEHQIRKAHVDGAVCDHRLRIRNYAPFNGAQAVVRLVEANIPAILISKYAQLDVDSEIRPYRKKIPVLLPKDDMDPQSLFSGLVRCKAELEGKVPPSRRARKTMVRIDEISGDLVDAFVPAWNPNLAVRFPLSLLPAQFRSGLQPNQRFFAKVNTDAEKADDLFFEFLTAAPDVDSTDDIF